VHYFCFRSYSQSFGAQSVSWKTREWAAFLQDDWRVAPNLTLHLGVRYELQQLPVPQQPNAALDALFASVGATSAFPRDQNNFGPRIGLEWAPFGRGRGVLRAGFGVYYGKLPGATVRAALMDTALPQSTVRVRITPTTETPCPQMPSVGFGYPCSFLAEPPGVVAATTSAMMFDRHFRLPMVEQGTLELEHALGGGVLGRAAYVMNLDRQLPQVFHLHGIVADEKVAHELAVLLRHHGRPLLKRRCALLHDLLIARHSCLVQRLVPGRVLGCAAGMSVNERDQRIELALGRAQGTRLRRAADGRRSIRQRGMRADNRNDKLLLNLEASILNRCACSG
jgi:hypothetical protein